ncbi:MAG: ARMT1-like domain-containing protein [Methanobacteriaceae archaeon]|nr:ARMT1-like domain-containing protein [Methanobacteriaceae archaeon]
MKVKYQCASCMLRQTREALDYTKVTDEEKMRITQEIIQKLAKVFNPTTQSNKLGTDLHTFIKKETKNSDPYKKPREKGNQLAKKIIHDIKLTDKFEDYVQLAIIGNIIDFGSLEKDVNIEKLIMDNLEQNPVINDTKKLKEAIIKSENILYLADNGGEIVFDKLLIQKIKKDYDTNIILALKEGPILNDALISDALDLNLDQYAKIISTGASSVGVVEEYISEELKELLKTSDLIISKGMGNFEGLTEMTLEKPVYYLLNSKCDVISSEIGVKKGSNLVIEKLP